MNVPSKQPEVELAKRSGNVMDCHATARSERYVYRASRPSQGIVNGVPSLNDLAVDGTLNTTNQSTKRPGTTAGSRSRLQSRLLSRLRSR